MKKLYIFLLILFLFTSCASSEEQVTYDMYEPDLKISIPDSDDFIVIKEWSFLLGGGADVYFEDSNGTQTFIGKTSGTDDGYKPFKHGEYELTWGDNSVTISYDFGSNDYWQTNTFTY